LSGLLKKQHNKVVPFSFTLKKVIVAHAAYFQPI
jgi:hypothetical protein